MHSQLYTRFFSISKLKRNMNLNQSLWRIKMFLLVLALVSLPLLYSCTAARSIGETFRTIRWSVQKDMRKPGEKLIHHPDKVWNRYRCAGKKLPMLLIEKNEVLPPELYAGEEVNHRLVYAMCPKKQSGVIRGSLIRSIYFKNKVIFQDISKDYEFKPGKWCVDVFITIPPEAEPGVYSLETMLTGTSRDFKKSTQFVVKPPVN